MSKICPDKKIHHPGDSLIVSVIRSPSLSNFDNFFYMKYYFSKMSEPFTTHAQRGGLLIASSEYLQEEIRSNTI